jgi:hypothetical protein
MLEILDVCDPGILYFTRRTTPTLPGIQYLPYRVACVWSKDVIFLWKGLTDYRTAYISAKLSNQIVGLYNWLLKCQNNTKSMEQNPSY